MEVNTARAVLRFAGAVRTRESSNTSCLKPHVRVRDSHSHSFSHSHSLSVFRRSGLQILDFQILSAVQNLYGFLLKF